VIHAIGRNFKVIGSSDGSNNLGVWGQSPQLPEANEGLWGGAPNAAAIFLVFSKNKAFSSIIWSKFLLKRVFKRLQSMLMRPQDLYAPGLCSSEFFPKITHCFLAYFGLNICFKTFLNGCEVCWCALKACDQDYMPQLSSLCYTIVCKILYSISK